MDEQQQEKLADHITGRVLARVQDAVGPRMRGASILSQSEKKQRDADLADRIIAVMKQLTEAGVDVTTALNYATGIVRE